MLRISFAFILCLCVCVCVCVCVCLCVTDSQHLIRFAALPLMTDYVITFAQEKKDKSDEKQSLKMRRKI